VLIDCGCSESCLDGVIAGGYLYVNFDYHGDVLIEWWCGVWLVLGGENPCSECVEQSWWIWLCGWWIIQVWDELWVWDFILFNLVEDKVWITFAH